MIIAILDFWKTSHCLYMINRNIKFEIHLMFALLKSSELGASD